MAGGVPGFFPVEEKNVVLAGSRALEPPEEERLGVSGVAVVGADRIHREGLRALAVALDRLRERVGKVYVHLDLDVFDPTKVGRANGFASEGGLTTRDLKTALGMVRERFTVAAAGIASYDPSFDTDGRVLAGALACVGVITAPDAGRNG
jgi:arginase family enzyme